jgi:hypothetical protein
VLLAFLGRAVHVHIHRDPFWHSQEFVPEGQERHPGQQTMQLLLTSMLRSEEVRAEVARVHELYPAAVFVEQTYFDDPLIGILCSGGRLVNFLIHQGDEIIDPFMGYPWCIRWFYRRRQAIAVD